MSGTRLLPFDRRTRRHLSMMPRRLPRSGVARSWRHDPAPEAVAPQLEEQVGQPARRDPVASRTATDRTTATDPGTARQVARRGGAAIGAALVLASTMTLLPAAPAGATTVGDEA